jgi:hypothetical protein
MKLRVSLDDMIFTVESVTSDAIYPDKPPGEPVIITELITGLTRKSQYDPATNYGFADDLNFLFWQITGCSPHDKEYQVIPAHMPKPATDEQIRFMSPLTEQEARGRAILDSLWPSTPWDLSVPTNEDPIDTQHRLSREAYGRD